MPADSPVGEQESGGNFPSPSTTNRNFQTMRIRSSPRYLPSASLPEDDTSFLNTKSSEEQQQNDHSLLHEIVLGALIALLFVGTISLSGNGRLHVNQISPINQPEPLYQQAHANERPVGGVDQGLLNVCRAFQSPPLGGVTIRVPQSELMGRSALLKFGTFGGLVMVATNEPIGYLMIPKAGSTTFRTILADYFGVPWKRGCHCNNKVSLSKSDAHVALRKKSHVVFSYVAHPIAHVLGGFYQVNSVARNVTSFKMYVNAMAEPSKYSWDNHCVLCNEHHRPQIQYLLLNQDAHGPTDLSFIGRLDGEHVAEDWSTLRRYLKDSKQVKVELPEVLIREREGNELYKQRRAKLEQSLTRNPDVMRRLCFARFQDFACLGFRFPDLCTDAHGVFNVTEFGPVPLLSKWDGENKQILRNV